MTRSCSRRRAAERCARTASGDWLFAAAAKSIGLKDLVPHELRQTAASLAIASGASVKSVQSMLGHASATLTLERYGHLYGDDLDVVVEQLDEAPSADYRAIASRPSCSSARALRPRKGGLTCGNESALGMIRTCDTRFRKPMLYPLSYEG